MGFRTARSRWRWVVAGLLIGGGLLLKGAPAGSAETFPSDASLRARFRAHRAAFDSLATKALADSQLVGAGQDPMFRRFSVYVKDSPRFDRLLSDDEVRATDRGDYRRLLGSTGLPSISRREGSVIFMATARHVARKGILYSIEPRQPVRKSLDGLERAGAGRFEAGYVPLAPRWYLFLEPGD
jgi:hypothetical protein